MRFVVLLLLLLSCTAPDRFGAGANASQYDYLGYNDTWFDSQRGAGFGVSLWVEWDLTKQPLPITFPSEPPWYLRKDGEAPTPIVIDNSSDRPEETGGIEKALDAGEQINSWSPTMQFGFWLFAIVVVGFVGRRVADHYLQRKRKP
jgi:hypothetical protein